MSYNFKIEDNFEVYNAVVIGGGMAGILAAIELKRMGLDLWQVRRGHANTGSRRF